MSGQSQMVLLIAGLHFLALACVAILMIPALRDAPPPPPRPDQGSDDGWGRGPKSPPTPPEPPRGGIPLPDAQPASIRLRDHTRPADLRPKRTRRPAREPDRRPVRSSGAARRPRSRRPR